MELVTFTAALAVAAVEVMFGLIMLPALEEREVLALEPVALEAIQAKTEITALIMALAVVAAVAPEERIMPLTLQAETVATERKVLSSFVLSIAISDHEPLPFIRRVG